MLIIRKPCHASVAAFRCYGACGMGPMDVSHPGSPYDIVMIKEVIAIDIVDISVLIVVDAVSGDLVCIYPESIHKLQMSRINARIYDGYSHIPKLCTGCLLHII